MISTGEELLPNKRLKAGGARRLRNESFFSAPQLKARSV